MAEPLSADQLVRTLRAEGLQVREYRNWRSHNRNHRGAWGPINGVMIHHTVTRGTDGSVRLCYEGYSGLPGPLCHGVIAKDGTVYLVGNGRANHAGLGDDNVLADVIAERELSPDNEANTDGNARFYGFECINMGDGEDPWPDAQLEAIEKAAAAICRAYGWNERSVIGHLEWQPGKVDPRGFSMDWMRDRIRNRLSNPPDQQEDEVTEDDKKDIARMVVDLLTGDRRKDLVDAIYHTDDVVASPDAADPDVPNKHWWVETYHEETYQRAREAQQGVERLNAKVDQLAVGGVDLDALAAKVADEMSARLEQ